MLESKTHLVAVVDDDPSVLKATTNLLRANGFETHSFSSASEFLGSTDVGQTECLVLDLRMPGMSGLELQRRLLLEDWSIPVIIVSAHATVENREEAKRAGALDFLSKPFSEEGLLNAVRKAFEKNRKLEKKRLAEDTLAALRNRDWSTLRSLMAENITWSFPGHGLISGEAEGVEEVIRRAQIIESLAVNITLEHVLVGKHGIVLSLQIKANRGELILDERLAAVFTLLGRRITAINTYLCDPESANSFCGPRTAA